MSLDPTLRSHHEQAMGRAGMPDLATRTFLLHLERVAAGASGTLGRDEIETVPELPDAEDLEPYAEAGRRALDRVVVVKLNGGLGTSMGLERAKSLLTVRDGHTFLDLIARQVLALRETAGAPVPLVMMNSFRTADDTEARLRRHDGLAVEDLPLGFVQHQVPKVVAATLEPAAPPADDPDLGWCPPGHGDLYTALATSGVLDRLLARGIEYAFVSNADNLGAVVDPALLGWMATEGADFVMEAADRTLADRKGGHLCRLTEGRLSLRESAQCPDEELEEFQDVDRYRYFNTNNLWVHLPSLAALLEHHDGVLPLATIVNRKTLDPRDGSSEPVLQLETAMGAALSLFPEARAVRVPRRRFSPVKTTADLLGVRSDAYRLTSDWRITLDESRDRPPTIALDDEYFKLVDRFEERVKHGVPSLRACDALTVEGDVWFGVDVEVRGTATIRSARGQGVVPSGTVVDSDIEV